MTAAVARALLLDLDGVVFRHPAAFARVDARVAAFARAHGLPDAVHEQLYRTHGHTLLGMRSLGLSVTIADFNRFVFDARFLEEVRRLPRPDDTERHAASVRRLVAHARARGTAAYIFTNAPRNWVHLALATTGLGTTFEARDVLVCEELGFLKPLPEAYRAAEERTRARLLTFVDDSVINLRACPLPSGNNSLTWCPLHYNPRCTCNAEGWTVRDMDQVLPYI